ncbi:MAG: caspase family protein [Elainellaceae cyanobacterium]
MRDALTVGINTYAHLPKLRTPANDAEAIACLLEEHGDFRVQRLPEVIRGERPAVARKTPVSVAELEAALIRLFKPSGANSPHTALFYFSGHGIQRNVGIRDGYLALSESHPDGGAPGLSLFWLRRLLQESPVRQRIVILDCCHSGELLTFLDADPGVSAGTDRMFMAACREYEAAYESLTSCHSVLTQAILDGLDPRTCSAGRVTNYALTSSVSRALSQQLQQPLFENSGGEIVLTSSGIQLPRQPKPMDEPCPYPGLAPFDVHQADVFFGRETLTRQLIDRVIDRPLVTVTGPSGCGKSSLLRAGFTAQMRRGHAFSGSNSWRTRLIQPGDRPLKQLAAAFIDVDSAGLERAEQLRRAETFLQDGGPGLVQLLRGNLLSDSGTGLGPRPRFVLVIDQFENLFAHCCSASLEGEGQQMIEAIAYALREAHDCFRVVIGLRADFLDHCLNNAVLSAMMTPGLLQVPPLTYEQLKAAILKPAQHAKLQCNPCLVYALLFDVAGMPGELSLLQGTLLQLWKQRQQNSLTQATYTALGGVQGILLAHASRVFHALSPPHQTAALQIFLALTQLGDGTEDTRRRVLKSTLFQLTQSTQVLEDTLDILVNEALVVTGHSAIEASEREPLNGGVTNSDATRSDICANSSETNEIIDVAHEALIRRWTLLQDWLAQHRNQLRQQRRLEDAAVEWHDMNRPNSPEYLLQGNRLQAAEAVLRQTNYPPARLVRQYVTVSRTAAQRSRWERRRLQLALPAMVALTLLSGAVQYFRSPIARVVRADRFQPQQAAAMAVGTAAPTEIGASGPYQDGSATVQDPAANQIAIASADGTIRLWRLSQQRSPRRMASPTHNLASPSPALPTEQDAVPNLAFSPDGSALAAVTPLASGRALVRVWSTETGALLQEQEMEDRTNLSLDLDYNRLIPFP